MWISNVEEALKAMMQETITLSLAIKLNPAQKREHPALGGPSLLLGGGDLEREGLRLKVQGMLSGRMLSRRHEVINITSSTGNQE